ncbi:hypothetical protein D0T84_00190 [Dysgonomonas sp. 521]|uniref:hypothetical protein n=1 Tax=Dysgonomonas sp. 521 TaxID=2302932 RepID=UPI0013D2D103|nr:hypothetical protein [Dysgonomonas sp. 521]NDV93338.1 hypothetical protein [Dysgonomonas sp. 521]
MKDIFIFIYNNKIVLIGILLGIIAGYTYWYYVTCYWGTYPLSAEWWVNCGLGAILGGLFATLYNREEA